MWGRGGLATAIEDGATTREVEECTESVCVSGPGASRSPESTSTTRLARARADEGRAPPTRADDAGPNAEKKRRRRRDDAAAAARRCDGVRAEMEGGDGRPEESR